MYYVAPETPMMSSVIADCQDLVPPQYFGQVYASEIKNTTNYNSRNNSNNNNRPNNNNDDDDNNNNNREVASSCWNLVVVELGCPAIKERLFSCFKDCQCIASSALTPSLIEAPSHRTPRMRKSLLDYITVT